MFAAQILIILITGPVMLSDNQGPYLTKPECEARAAEIANMAVMNLSPISVKTRCLIVPIDGQAV